MPHVPTPYHIKSTYHMFLAHVTHHTDSTCLLRVLNTCYMNSIYHMFLPHTTCIPHAICSTRALSSYHVYTKWIPNATSLPPVSHVLLPHSIGILHATCLPHASKPCHLDSSCHMCATCSFYMPQGFHMSYYCHFFLTHATCLSNHKLHNSYVNATEFFKKYEFLCPAMPPHTTRRFITCVTAWCHNIF